MVLKGLIFNNFFFKGCGGFESNDFQKFFYWEDMAVMKGLIFNNSHFGMEW